MNLDAPRKVLIVTLQLIPHEGGLSTHVVDLVRGLQRGGRDVRLIHRGQAERPLWQRLLYVPVSLGSRDRYSTWNMVNTVSRLGRMVQRELDRFGPDVVHCHDVYATAGVVDVCRQRGTPVVETVHGPALYEARQQAADRMSRFLDFIGRCEKAAFAGADLFIAVDSGQARILVEDYGVDAGRITVIFNSVDAEDVRRTAAIESPLRPSHPYFLVPRRLVPKTGVRYAIEALALAPRKDTHMVIAGDGQERAALEELAASLGLADRVHFLGSVPRGQLLPLFSRAAAVLVPSVPAFGVIEATSLAVMEAMACGTVAIASGIGGLAELIADGQTGLLVPPGDSAALARAMTSVLDGNDLRTRLIATATRKVEQDYSTEAWLNRVLQVYQRTLARRPGASEGESN